MEGTVFKFCVIHVDITSKELFILTGDSSEQIYDPFSFYFSDIVKWSWMSEGLFVILPLQSPLRMHSGLQRVTLVKRKGCSGEGSGGRSMAVQSHANIMQLLSAGQKALLLSRSGTWHRNAQKINSRRRHRDTGSKVSLSHYPYMLHLCVVR